MRVAVAPVWQRTGHDGVIYDSKAEMRRYYDLCLLVKAGVIRDLERQPTFPVTITSITGEEKHLCTYTADFSYVDVRSEKLIIEEVKSKGSRTPVYMLRRKAAELYHGMKVKEHMV